MRHNQEKVFENQKDLSTFHERVNGERLDNQAKRKNNRQNAKAERDGI